MQARNDAGRFRPGRALVVSVILASALSSPGAALASFSMLDGDSFAPGTSAATLGVGVPSFRADYLAGVTPSLDVGAGLLLNYRLPSLEPAVLVRFKLFEDGPSNFALTGRAAFHWNVGLFEERRSPPNVGLRLTPAAVFGYRPHPSYAGHALLEIPFLRTFAHGGGWALPLRIGGGFELGLTDDARFVGRAAMGPRFEGGGGHVGGVFLDVDVWGGISLRLF